MYKLKNSKKVIIITLIIATILSFLTGIVTYKITLNSNYKENNKKSLVVGNYSLQYGMYKGFNIEYEWDEQTQKKIESSKQEIILKLNSDGTYELTGEKHKFLVSGSFIIVPDFNNMAMFEVIGNNKIVYQVDSGVEMTYSNK